MQDDNIQVLPLSPNSSSERSTSPTYSYFCEEDYQTQNCCMDWFKAKIVNPIIDLLSSNLSPHSLALSFAFGIFGGLFPVPGVTTFVCFLLIYLFKLNTVATQICNLLMTPLQLISCIPLIKFSAGLFGRPLTLSPSELSDKFSDNFFGTLSEFSFAIFCAILVWALGGIVLTYVLYRALIPAVIWGMKHVAQKDHPVLHEEFKHD